MCFTPALTPFQAYSLAQGPGHHGKCGFAVTKVQWTGTSRLSGKPGPNNWLLGRNF
jgi:hypothetical protein